MHELITAPSVEPITPLELRHHLRMEEDQATAHSNELNRLIRTARHVCENYIGKRLITQTWADYYDLDCRLVRQLSQAPLAEVSAVELLDQAGDVASELIDGFYVVPQAGKLVFEAAQAHDDARDVLGLRITYTVGFGDRASDVPQDLRYGMMEYIAYQFAHAGEVIDTPLLATSYWQPHRRLTI